MSNSNDKKSLLEKSMSRRSLLKSAGIGGMGVVIGASGLGGVLTATDSLPKTSAKDGGKNTLRFYGTHQKGIITPMQDNVYFTSLDVVTDKRSELIDLFKQWTEASAAMMAGQPVGVMGSNSLLPPVDTGEAAGLEPSNLSITFGVGPSLFSKDGKDRFGLKSKQPAELKQMPKFPLDDLKEKWTGGDLCIQACSDDPQVTFHAVRNLIRIARGKAVLRWAQEGFLPTKKANKKQETPRNLFGFKDGTVNPETAKTKETNEHVWVQPGDGPNWLVGGSYLVVRRIQMFIEVWDRTTLQDQENTFGRHRSSGAPLGMKKEHDKLDLAEKGENGELRVPDAAHARRAHGKGKEQLLRRSYSYSGGMDPATGSLDAGLLFLSFQRTPSKQFVPIQERLAKMDELNEYISHKGSAVFACLPGAEQGGFIGKTLF